MNICEIRLPGGGRIEVNVPCPMPPEQFIRLGKLVAQLCAVSEAYGGTIRLELKKHQAPLRAASEGGRTTERAPAEDAEAGRG